MALHHAFIDEKNQHAARYCNADIFAIDITRPLPADDLSIEIKTQIIIIFAEECIEG